MAFGGADVGGHRHDGHAGDQTSGDRQRRRRGRSGQHRDPVSGGDPLGHRRCRADQITAAQRRPADAHGVAYVGSACDRGGIQRCQQHDREVTHTALSDTGRVNQIHRVASREVYRNNWLTLREDDIRHPDGSPGIYSVIDKPTYALVIPRDGDRFHLVEQFRYPLGMRRWEFPQGTAPGQEDLEPIELANRELREETGLRASLDGAAGHARRRAGDDQPARPGVPRDGHYRG